MSDEREANVDGTPGTFTLPSGRQIAFLDVGDGDGAPLFYFHASPGSRLEALRLDEAARTHRFRLIAMDRPGMGASQPAGDYTLLEHTADVAAIADHLGLSRFSVLGVSGGGTTVLSCAAAFPQRIERAMCVSGWAPVAADDGLRAHLAPFDRIVLGITERIPALLETPFSVLGASVRRLPPKAFLTLIASSLSEADKRALKDPELERFLARDVEEAFSQGAAGPAHDALLRYAEWGFPIEEIALPITLVHGTDDKMAPFAFAEYLAAHLENATLHAFEDAGHLLALEQPDAVMALLAAS